MKRTTLVLAAVVLLLGGMGQARADRLLYDNGPLGPGPQQPFQTGWVIGPGFGNRVSDSFTLNGTSTLTKVQAGIWVNTGATPVSVDWSIGTTPLASDVASGSAAPLSNTLAQPGFSGRDIYESEFSLGGASLDPGTYYLTLTNLVPSDRAIAFWDINNGPSVAYGTGLGNLNGFLFPGSNSDSFQVYGNASAVPEPASLTLLGIGAAGLLGYRWRGRKQPRA